MVLGDIEQQFRQKKMGILKFCAELLCHDRGVILFSVMCHVPLASQRFFEKAMAEVKSTDGSAAFVSKLVADPFAMVNEQLHSVLQPDFWKDAVVARGCASAHHGLASRAAWELNRNFCSELALSGLLFASPPWSFLRLLDADPRVAQQAMQDTKAEYEAVMALERDSLKNESAGAWLHDLFLHTSALVREMWVRLQERWTWHAQKKSMGRGYVCILEV